MKNVLAFFMMIFLAASCGNHAVEKPDNLIEKDKMVDIIYDLSVLEATQSQKPLILENNSVNPDTYIYKKYHIDSLQFAKSNQYYASDLAAYKEMYEEVAKKLGADDKKQPFDPNAPQVQ